MVFMYLGQMLTATFQKRSSYMACLMEPALPEVLFELHTAMKMFTEQQRKLIRTRLAAEVLDNIKDPKQLPAWTKTLHGYLLQHREDVPFIEILQTSGSGKRHQLTETYKKWEKDFCKILGVERPSQSGKVFGGDHTIFLSQARVEAIRQDKQTGVLPDAKSNPFEY